MSNVRTCSECGDDFNPRHKRNGGLSVHCDDCALETTSRPTVAKHVSAMASHSDNPGKWGGERGEVKTSRS